MLFSGPMVAMLIGIMLFYVLFGGISHYLARTTGSPVLVYLVGMVSFVFLIVGVHFPIAEHAGNITAWVGTVAGVGYFAGWLLVHEAVNAEKQAALAAEAEYEAATAVLSKNKKVEVSIQD